MAPRYENHVWLDTTVKDAWGVPVVGIACSHSQDEINMFAHMKQALPQLGQPAARRSTRTPMAMAAGVSRLGYFEPSCSRTTASSSPGEQFTRRVVRAWATDRQLGLNSYCQCWDADNVFVTDGACFVSSVFQNPTLTMMGVTVRACRFIIGDYAKRLASGRSSPSSP
jgi:GMC oxidoreductase